MASVRERAGAGGYSTWAVLYRHGKRQGSKAFATESAAKRWATVFNELGVDKGLKLLAEENLETNSAGTLDELAKKWHAAIVNDVTPNIHKGYLRDYDNWISPVLGHRAAQLIDETDVQDWVDWMKVTPSAATGKPLSPKSIADRHAILHQIFKWASAKTRTRSTGVDHNPCKGTALPTRTKKPPKGLYLSELRRLLAVGNTEHGGQLVDQDAADLVAFMAGTGWRIGESVAVLAGAIEDDGDRVYVTMDRVHRRGVGWTDGGKSEASVGRRLRILGPAVAVVRRRLVGLGPDDFLFTFADGRPGVKRDRLPWNENSFRDLRWPRLVAAAGLTHRKPTPHWLRHTHVLVCHAAGMSMAEISRRLGHEDIQTTINIYGRMIEDMTEDVAANADAILNPAQPDVVAGEVLANKDEVDELANMIANAIRAGTFQMPGMPTPTPLA